METAMEVGTEQDPTLNLVGQWPLQQFMDNSRATGHYREREREREVRVWSCEEYGYCAAFVLGSKKQAYM